MTLVESLQEISKSAEAVVVAGAALLGSVSVLATLLSHIPKLPPRVSEFFARVGIATKKYSVNLRPTKGPVEPL